MLPLDKALLTAAEPLQAAQLRLTAFFSSQEGLVEPTWWKEMTGSEPETRTLQPNLFQFQEMGMVNGMNLVLSIQGSRVDWLLLPPNPDAANPLPSRWIGSVAEVLPPFSELMEKWLTLAPDGIVRRAFGLISDEPAHNKEDTYALLSKLLPSVKLDAGRSSDFLYQINRPRPSKVLDGLTINRLGKWSATSYVAMKLTVNPGPDFSSQAIGKGELSCRTEIDVNTATPTEALPKDLSFNLYKELRDFALELATRGDVAE